MHLAKVGDVKQLVRGYAHTVSTVRANGYANDVLYGCRATFGAALRTGRTGTHCADFCERQHFDGHRAHKVGAVNGQRLFELFEARDRELGRVASHISDFVVSVCRAASNNERGEHDSGDELHAQ